MNPGSMFIKCINPACEFGEAADAGAEAYARDTTTNGSVLTSVVRFTTIPTSDATYTVADSEENGTSIKIARTGTYFIQFAVATEESSAVDQQVIAISQDLTSLASLSVAGILGCATYGVAAATSDGGAFCSAMVNVGAAAAANAALAVIRALWSLNTEQSSIAGQIYLRIKRTGDFAGA